MDCYCIESVNLCVCVSNFHYKWIGWFMMRVPKNYRPKITIPIQRDVPNFFSIHAFFFQISIAFHSNFNCSSPKLQSMIKYLGHDNSKVISIDGSRHFVRIHIALHEQIPQSCKKIPKGKKNTLNTKKIIFFYKKTGHIFPGHICPHTN